MSAHPRFLLDKPLNAPGEYQLDRQESHHAFNVLRLRVGAEVIVFDGIGRYALAEISYSGKDSVRVRVDEIRTEARRPIHITIATCIPKGKRWQMLVEKCTELGVDRLIPMLSGRSVVKGEGDAGRWKRWAGEAAKQSRRAFIPEILEPMKLNDTLVLAKQDQDLVLLADADGESPRFYQVAIKDAGRVLVMIGPEGGFTDEEATACAEIGIAKIRLSPFVLRVETAAATACALIRDM